ncbi:MAG: ABC transporter permease [Acidobacteriaceae bacterium]
MPHHAGHNPASFERTLASARTTMLFSEVVALAVDSFRTSKVRFLLTMLGMVIGSASIILVVTIGLTGRQYATNLIQSIGPNEVELEYLGGTSVGGTDNTQDFLTIDDMHAVQQQVPGIVAASPVLDMHDSISMGGGVVRDTLVLGVMPQYKTVRNLKVLSGRFFDDEDESTHTKVAVVTVPFAKSMFGSASAAVGRTFSISGIPFVIIGTFKESVETFGQTEIDEQTILIPYQVARYFTGSNAVKQIYFSMATASEVIPASKLIVDVVHARHRASSVYRAQNLTQVLNVMARIATGLTIVLTLAAAITLIVSGVGIMNSMLANVQARIKEIGIRKALGATSREIRMQFLVEAVSISLAGGVIGVFAGLAIPVSVNFFTEYKIPISYLSVVIALGTSVLVGVIFGTLPANRAARLDPVETLKYE